MPSIEENQQRWNEDHDWSRDGNEWSESWGSPKAQWENSILPRVKAFLPAARVLEIAPGRGRWTEFLLEQCESLIGVDLSEKCVAACRERFKDRTNLELVVNDGSSLDMIEDDSIDFAFSFDSLVHAEEPDIAAYVEQLSAKLKPDGVAFLHHSNMHEHDNYLWWYSRLWRLQKPLIRLGVWEDLSPHWRAKSMSAKKMSAIAERLGMRCLKQELVNWGTRRLIDCFSTLVHRDSKWDQPGKIIRNKRFMDEARAIRAGSGD